MSGEQQDSSSGFGTPEPSSQPFALESHITPPVYKFEKLVPAQFAFPVVLIGSPEYDWCWKPLASVCSWSYVYWVLLQPYTVHCSAGSIGTQQSNDAATCALAGGDKKLDMDATEGFW